MPHGAPGRRPADGSGPRPDDLGGPRRAAEGPGPEGTGRRPRPEVPGRPGEDVTGHRLPDGSGPRPRPENLDGPRRPVDGPRRLADGPAPEGPRLDGPPLDGTGRRPRTDLPGRPGDDVPGTGRRLPDGSGPRPRPDDLNGPRRPVDGPGPEGTGRRPAEGGPRRLADGPAPDGTGRRPRPEVPGRPGPVEGATVEPGGRRPVDGFGEDATGHRLPDGSGPRPRTDLPGAPRRPVDGPGPEGTGRRPAPGDGPRNRPEDADGPRRLAEGGATHPAVDAPGRRFAEDPAAALDQGPAVPGPSVPGPVAAGPTARAQIDLSLTTEMEAISDDVKKRREVDHTLARFSAVHDELAEQERQRKERRQKLMPWKADHDEDATEYASPVEGPDDGDDDRPRGHVRTAQHSKIVKSVKAVALAAAVLVFVSTGVGWGAMLYIDSKIVEVDALGSNSAAVHQAEKQLGDENFLIVGSDTRAGARPEDGVGDSEAEPGARSDVLMLAHIPADRKRMVVVSVPRDLLIERPDCERWDPSTGEYTGEQLARESDVKANEPYAVGGPQCVAKFMTELTGLEINHFISVDFNGFKGMVDAVGAVTVCVPKPMVDEQLGTIFDKAGKYDIGGTKALDYVRARKVSGEVLGDYDRVTRQQQFLSALLRKAMSSEILLNPGKLNGFLNAFASATVGDNIGVNDMLTLAQSLRSLEAGRVSFVTVPHDTEEGETLSHEDNVEVLRVEDTKALFQAIIDGTPLPKEKADTSAPADQAQQQAPAPGPRQGKVVDPRGLKIQVRNGDEDADGAAGQATGELEDLGYQVVFSGNGEAVDKTIIKYSAGGEDIAETLKASVPGATLVVDPSMGGAVELLIGPGWDGVVQAPQGAPAGDPGKAAPPEDLSVVNAAVDPCAG
ncbi:LCP family protein [Saccharothrix sp. BKS2]|uniref:LCP family protein n=1 Tax=Saccharothrix sp. BKS2 TaxID=3064400 RepID=UPI0039EC8050